MMNSISRDKLRGQSPRAIKISCLIKMIRARVITYRPTQPINNSMACSNLIVVLIGHSPDKPETHRCHYIRLKFPSHQLHFIVVCGFKF